MFDIALTQAEIVGMNPEARVYEDTQKSVEKYFAPMAKQRLINRVGDKTVMKNIMVSYLFSDNSLAISKDFKVIR